MFKNKLSVVIFSAVIIFFFGWLGHFSAQIVYNNAESCVELPVIMYHSVLKDPDRAGKYVISPDLLREDINYLHAAGYTTVSMAQVIDYVENNGYLPPRSVMLTFDDGSYNNYGYVLPILEELDANAVFAVVGQYTDEYSQKDIANLSFGYMRWCDVKDMVNNPHAELANHSYDFHSNNHGRNGSTKNQGESASEYIRIFTDDTQKLQKRFLEETGSEPIIYCYPFGAYSKESLDAVKRMGFKSSFSCTEGVNIINHNSECLYLLKRNNRPSGISPAEYFSGLLSSSN